jgi:hypothetical protein
MTVMVEHLHCVIVPSATLRARVDRLGRIANLGPS